MKRLIFFFAAVFYLTGIAAYAQSLGDLAKEEQKRRESIPDEKVTTIEYTPPDAPDEEDATGEAGNKDNLAKENVKYPESSLKKAALDRETALYGKPESQWREAMTEARNRVARLEEEAKELTSHRNALQLQYNRTNRTRRGSIGEEINKTKTSQDMNRKNLEQAREALQSLQNEARSSGAPPGWIR